MEMEQPGLEPTPAWCASVAGGGLIHCTKVVPLSLFLMTIDAQVVWVRL